MAVNLKIVSQVVACGIPGPAGKSAYQIAVDNGFEGTESEWLKELHPFKGWFDSVSELEEEHSAPSVGEYAYVKGATSSDPVKIYECSTEGSWSDSGRTVDTSTVQTFRSGEAVNDVGIDSEPTAGSNNLVKSGGVFENLTELEGGVYEAFNNPSKGFVYDAVVKDGKKPVTSGAVYEKTVKIYDDDNILSIADNNGNVIAKINSGVEIDENGVIKTSSFNSGDTASKEDSVVSKGETTFHLSFSDANGDIIVGINSGVEVNEAGRVKTETFDSNLIIKSARSRFPKLDVKKEEFKWLDIGNSHSLCALKYLRNIAISQEVDLSNVAFCRLSRGGSSFKSWVKGFHDEDTSGEGDALTGGMYDLVKDFGELSVKVTGNTYTEPNGTATPVSDRELSRSSLRFWGGDCSILRSLLKENKFDLITIHQRYIGNDEYDTHNRWRDDSEYGFLTEFIRIIKTYQPQASVGYLFALVPFGYAGSTLSGVSETHGRFSITIKKFLADTGIDVVIPCDTALENLRYSSIPNSVDEGSGVAENIISRNGFNYDSAHTAFGVAAYTMSCVAWETIFAIRYGKSVYGNTYQELISDDVGTTQKYLQGSFINNNGEKIMIDNGAWNAPLYIGCTSQDGGQTWSYSDTSKATIRVTPDNAQGCHMAAILAVNEMWSINNPDNVTI